MRHSLSQHSNSVSEKIQFNHVEKMRLLCEANDIIKSLNLVLHNTEMDEDTKKAKVDEILSMKDLIQD